MVRLLNFDTEAGILRALRMQVLYPCMSETKSLYPGDENAAHIGAFDANGVLVGVASLFTREDGSLQLRGMATSDAARGTGAGREIVRVAEAYAHGHDEAELWCNARVTAIGFYKKCGWHVEGEEFQVPDIGPHYVMRSTYGI